MSLKGRMSQILTVLFLFPSLITLGQGRSITISDKLEIIQLSSSAYIHISEGSNGMVIISGRNGIIVSAPPSDEVTQQLIDWVKNFLKVEITGVVIDSWHPDNMEGLDVFQRNHIKSYSSELTREIAASKGLPIPQIGFSEKMELTVGVKKVVLQYFGPAHTQDGIVVWIPDEKILFGSNGVRNYNGWVGNIGDACINKWSETVEKIKKEFGSARFVVPGHGAYGGVELLDYTISLYKPCKWGEILKIHDVKPSKMFNFGKIFVACQSEVVLDSTVFFDDVIAFVDKGQQYLMIESPTIKYKVDSKVIESDFGRIRVLNKAEGPSLFEADGYYKKLRVQLREDAVGMTVVMKEFMQ